MFAGAQAPVAPLPDAARPVFGALSLVLAAALFALAAAMAKRAGQLSGISAVEMVFFRYLAGFVAIGSWALIRHLDVRPRRLDYVALRVGLNIVAVTLLYMGVQATTVTKANMLNMTYPVFVFALAPLVNREKNRPANLLWLLLALAALYLIILPRFSSVNRGDLLSLLSAVVMGAAVPILRESRKYDTSVSIMFSLTLVGSVVTFLLSLPHFFLPGGPALLFLLGSAAAGSAGQVLVTAGYRHVRAATGSLLESSRIVFGSLLGALFFAEVLTLRLLVAALLLLAAQLGATERFRGLRFRGGGRGRLPPGLK